MLRTLLAGAGLLLLGPAVASAAPFGELPFQPVAGSATCLRATGTAGELVRQSERTVRIVGDIRRAARGDDNGLSTEGTAGNGRRSFHVELTRAARVRYVRVNVYEYFGRRDRTITVEVR
jgi:hypothetical protein